MKLDDAPLIGEKLIAESKNVYVIGRAIGRGGYGIVYECCDLSNRKFALKVGKRRSISLEIKVLKLGDGFFHFVKLIDEGLLPDDGQQFFVMELLWKNLSELQRLMPTKRFSLSTAIRCSLQTINGIEELHSIGYISRDLKPSNFIVRKPSENNNLIYLIDFGIARKYIDHNGALKPRRLVGAWRGTARYCSLANHFKQDQCRRDDVECWFYMTIEFINGKLPWSEISKYERDEIAKKKQSLRKSEREAILGECPDGWSDILDIIDSCGFEAAPEYDTISSIVDKAMDANSITYEMPYDWQTINELCEREPSQASPH